MTNSSGEVLRSMQNSMGQSNEPGQDGALFGGKTTPFEDNNSNNNNSSAFGSSFGKNGFGKKNGQTGGDKKKWLKRI